MTVVSPMTRKIHKAAAKKFKGGTISISRTATNGWQCQIGINGLTLEFEGNTAAAVISAIKKAK